MAWKKNRGISSLFIGVGQWHRLSRGSIEILENAIAGFPHVSSIKGFQEIDSAMADAQLDDEKAFIEWGKYGWTVNPYAKYSMYFRPPQNQADADKKAMRYCSEEIMDKYFKRLFENKRCRCSDVDESIFCFRNKKYRACATLLVELIDGELIRAAMGEGYKKFCIYGVKHLRNSIMDSDGTNDWDIRQATLLYLDFQCLDHALTELFRSDDGFKKEPLLINRNFLLHGMYKGKTRRRDCIQLYLMYGNLLQYTSFCLSLKQNS